MIRLKLKKNRVKALDPYLGLMSISNSIFDNWSNGNKKDCTKLIKKYGFKKFIVDALSLDDYYLSIIKYYAEFSKGVN